MLVNIKKDKKKEKLAKQVLKHRLRDVEDRDDQQFSNEMRKYAKRHPFKLNTVFKLYTPCGEEYVQDTETNFTGVYLCNNTYDAEIAINALSNTKVLETLVDFGCVDNASQAIGCFKKYVKQPGSYIIIMTPLKRDRVYSPNEAYGTFRWHKNGGYAGKANICSEYFLDEPNEKLMLVYQYEVIKVR